MLFPKNEKLPGVQSVPVDQPLVLMAAGLELVDQFVVRNQDAQAHNPASVEYPVPGQAQEYWEPAHPD
jgi:hypothetical protein